MDKRTASLSVAACLVVVGCQERTTAPGSCPEFCTNDAINVVDSVFGQAIVGDSSFSGYAESRDAAILQVVGPAGFQESRVLLRFSGFPDSVTVTGDTTATAVSVVDSFRLDLEVAKRTPGPDSIRIRVHSIPIGFDEDLTFSQSESLFADSTIIGSVFVSGAGDLPPVVSVLMSGDVFTDFDSAGVLTAAVGVSLDSASLGFVSLASTPSLQRFFQLDSAGVSIQDSDERNANFSNSIQSALSPVPPASLAVGGLPSARIIFRFEGIDSVLASTQVVGAVLELTPSEPLLGGVGDSLLVQANPVTADLGKKSIVLIQPLDSLLRGAARIPVGSIDLIAIDVTIAMRVWALEPDIPRALMLLVAPEAGSIAELRIHSSESAMFRPRLRLTFISPVAEGRVQ